MLDFSYTFPVNLVFGAGKVKTIGEHAIKLGSKAIIVTGKSSTKKTGLLDRVLGYLENAGIKTVVFNGVESNPTTDTVQRGAVFAKENECDLVIALGGGSTMDAAKGIAFMSVNGGDITEYIFGKPGIGALPIITVTTTAGTGSEGDCLAVLTNPETKDKKSLKSPFIYPRVSIVDPELMQTLPRGMIAATGIDALAHSIEAYVARRGNTVTEALAIKAIELIGKNLTRVYEDPQDIEAWSNIAIANTFGGMVIDSAGVALPHGLEHPISGLLNVTHGEGLAAIFIKWMEYTIEEAEEKFAKIAEALGEDIYGISTSEAAKKSIEAMKRLLKALKLTPTLGELGVKEEHVDWLTENALRTMTYAISNNPKVPDGQKIKELYLSCL
jgi:alcohol dehydrogenase class IV